MAKILLDIFLILLFIAVGTLQVYVIYRIKDLKESYNDFMNSQKEFVKFIEKARQSLMLVNSQATDILPELKKHIDDSETLMQDFSFVLARANKKIDVLQEISSLSDAEKTSQKVNSDVPAADINRVPVSPMYNYQSTTKNQEIKNESSEFAYDPVLARLEQLEKEDSKKEDVDYLKSDNKRAQQQQELIEKALKEIL